MEVLGTYDPRPQVPLATDVADAIDEVTGLPIQPKKYKDIQLDQSRTKYWLGVGAQPSEPVERLLSLVSHPFSAVSVVSEREGDPGGGKAVQHVRVWVC